MGANRLVVGCLLAAGIASAAYAQQMQIQFAEPVTVSAAPGSSQFDAYGQRFNIELTGNDRALAKLPLARKAELSRIHLTRGSLAGQPGSWVRLTQFDGRVEGAIWDGRDLYTVTTYERISRYLTTPLAVDPRQTVVFRLSDTANALPRAFCAAAPTPDGLASNNGLVQYRKLVAELATGVMAEATLSRQLELSLIADATYQTAFGTNATAEMLARFNVAEGIYAEQADLLLLATDIRLAPTSPDPFTSTSATALIGQLATYRRNTPAVSARGIAHLVTGRDLDGDTVGIAIMRGVCSVDEGVSLGDGTLTVSMSGFLMAHELGHNLGAEHDGDAAGACPNVAQTYLMAPTLNNSGVFSQCSLDSMRTLINGASCITPAVYAHVELAPAGPLVNAENDNPFVLRYTVRSSGTRAAQSVVLDVDPYGTIPATSVNPSAGCTITNGDVHCELGSVPAGEERLIDVTFLPNAVGSTHVDAIVSAANNQSTRDESQRQQVDVLPNVEGDVAISATPTTALTGDPVDFLVTVRSLRTRTLANARVSLSTGGMTFSSVSGAATCVFGGTSAVCSAGDIPGGQQRQFTVRAIATATGERQVRADMFADNDSQDSNNHAQVVVHLEPKSDVGLEAASANQYVAFNDPFELRANIRSYGTQGIANVSFSMTVQTPIGTANGVDTVTIGGVECVATQRNTYQCVVGTLAAGESKPVVIRGRGLALGTYAFLMRTYAPQQDNQSNDELARGVNIMHPVDVEVFSSTPISGSEQVEFSGNIYVGSNGMQAVPSSQVTIALPAQVRVVRFFTDVGSCTITDPQHLRCTLSFASAGLRASISWVGVASAPGVYSATVTAVTPNDGLTANDSKQIPITIAALLDVGVEQFTVPEYVLVGRDYNIPVMITVGSRPVDAATVRVIAQVGAQVRAVTIPSGNCTREDEQRLQCTLASLAPGTSVPIIVTVASRAPLGVSILTVDASAVGDNYQQNNIKNANFRTIETGDLQLAVADANATANVGATLNLPRISIRHAGPVASGRLEISLPTFATLSAVPVGIGACTGTTLLRCDLPSGWPESQALELDFAMAANATGTFTSTVRVYSGNDTNATNDEASFVITVNAAPPPVVTPPASPPANPSSGGGGGGGGGRIEWALLAALAIVAVRRARRRPADSTALCPRIMFLWCASLNRDPTRVRASAYSNPGDKVTAPMSLTL